jgi:hypothetical protein
MKNQNIAAILVRLYYQKLRMIFVVDPVFDSHRQTGTDKYNNFKHI